MKRGQSSEEAPAVDTDGPATKRAKTTPSTEESKSPAAAATPSVPVTTAPSLSSTSLDGQGPNAGNGEQQTWTKVEKRKKKKAAKNEAKNDMVQPRFMYSNHEIARRNHAIGIEEVRDLVLHLIADGPTPNWLRVENGNLVQRVVVLMVPGLTNELLALPPIPTSATTNPNLPISIPLPGPLAGSGAAAAIPFIATTFSHACPTRAPGDQNRMHSVLSTFFSCTVSAEEKKRRMKVKSEKSKSDPTQYLLALEQMMENDYPIPSYMADVFQKPVGWVETPEQPPPADLSVRRPIYAIDCEMCLTEDGKELTRVCLIDFYSGNVVFDQLVKPAKPIIDYLTRFSGITEQHLAPITTTLADVQQRLLGLLSPPAANPFSTSSSSSSAPSPTPILMGHSLESDLKALKLCHPYCIDTALMYHHPRGRPLKPGLAWLTKRWCGREIQARGEGGHDPEEDARACLDLLRKKLEEGPGFGEYKTDLESIFERMGRARGGSRRSVVVDFGDPGRMHGSKATTSVGCKSDEDVVEGVVGAVGSHEFVFGRLMGLADTLGWVTQKNTQDPNASPAPPAAATPEQINTSLQALNGHLTRIHASLPPRTAFVVFTGHSDPRKMTALSGRKQQFENGLRSGKKPEQLAEEGLRWSAAEGRDLEGEVELARRGLAFLGIKS